MSVEIAATASLIHRRIFSQILVVSSILSFSAAWAASPPAPAGAVDSYRRLDWTGQGTFHRLGLFREQKNAVDQYYDSGTVTNEAAAEVAPAAQAGEADRYSLEAHANSMLFRSDNIFNTEADTIEESEYAVFVGASFEMKLDPFKLTTGFDQSYFRFEDLTDNDFDIATLRQGISFERYFRDNTASMTLTPSWQYSELSNRSSGDKFLTQWTYGLNNEFACFPATWLIGTFSYGLAYLDADAPGGANDKFKHDFNAGITLVPLADVKLYVSPSVQFSYEDFENSDRQDDAWTPTCSITYQPLSFLAVDAVTSYTDSNSNAEQADYKAWANTLFLRLFCRL